jgi:hypothetical protein
MSIDNLFFYINLHNGGLCEDAINLFSCSFIHNLPFFVFFFFLRLFGYLSVHEICISRHHSFVITLFLVSVSCVIDMTTWNMLPAFLVIRWYG